jgi:hypothetical protein
MLALTETVRADKAAFSAGELVTTPTTPARLSLSGGAEDRALSEVRTKDTISEIHVDRIVLSEAQAANEASEGGNKE